MAKTAEAKNKEGLVLRENFVSTLTKAIVPPTLPDIVTFAESPYFCGKKLYPRQKTLLRLMFLETDHMTDYDLEVIEGWRNSFYNGSDREGVSPDIWDRVQWLKENGYSHFRTIEYIGGRRSGKGHLGGIIGAYKAFYLLTLDNPQWHYGIEPGHSLYMFVMATSLTQARDMQFKDISDTISGARCFDGHISTNQNLNLHLVTPADKRRIADYERRGATMEKEVASVRINAMSSSSRGARGAAAFSVFFDEFAHMLTGTEGPNTDAEIYKSVIPSLGQVKKDALIYIPTSPYTKVGQAYKIYEQGIAVDADGKPVAPATMVVQLPSWESYSDWDNPKVVRPGYFKGALHGTDDEMRIEEKADPEAFKVERRAQWADTINAYLDPQKITAMFEPITMEDGTVRILENETSGVMRWVYRGHADPSKSNDNFAMAIGHTEPIMDPELGQAVHHVFFDWLKVWKPEDYPDHTIDYMVVEAEIVDIIMEFFNLKQFSYDQYGGFIAAPYLQDHLRKRGHKARVHEETFSQKSNQIRAERFKSALNMGWIHSPKDTYGPDNRSLLELELRFLQVKNGRVDHQSVGAITTNDLSDAVMEVSSQLLADQIDRLLRGKQYGNTRLSVGAPGGYHTGGGFAGPTTENAREKLNNIGRKQGAKRTYGVGW